MLALTRRLVRLALALAVFALVPSCGPPTPPQGFMLAIQLVHVNVRAVDSLQLTFATTMEGTMRTHFLAPTRGMSFDNGDITISVDAATGHLLMTITGRYFAAHAMASATGDDPRFELELWSDDHATHPAPQVQAVVMRAGAPIAMGLAYLPSWPLVLGATGQVNVPCLTGMETTTCAGM